MIRQWLNMFADDSKLTDDKDNTYHKRYFKNRFRGEITDGMSEYDKKRLFM